MFKKALQRVSKTINDDCKMRNVSDKQILSTEKFKNISLHRL